MLAAQPVEFDGLGARANGLDAGDFSGTAADPFPFSGSGDLADDFTIRKFNAGSFNTGGTLNTAVSFNSAVSNAGESNTGTLNTVVSNMLGFLRWIYVSSRERLHWIGNVWYGTASRDNWIAVALCKNQRRYFVGSEPLVDMHFRGVSLFSRGHGSLYRSINNFFKLAEMLFQLRDLILS
jgi:hypothetical protein